MRKNTSSLLRPVRDAERVFSQWGLLHGDAATQAAGRVSSGERPSVYGRDSRGDPLPVKIVYTNGAKPSRVIAQATRRRATLADLQRLAEKFNH